MPTTSFRRWFRATACCSSRAGGITTVFGTNQGETLRGPKRVGKGGDFFASPVSGDGKIYLASENGYIVVLKASPDYEELARNNVGESIIATPAIADGCLFVRTRTQLMCFAVAERL